jgi:methylmalonyl-CoA mutase cobalamin-binding domain/chain
MDRIKDMGLADIMVLVGGNIPQKDIGTLQEYGVAGVFPVGTKLDDIIDFIQKGMKDRLGR